MSLYIVVRQDRFPVGDVPYNNIWAPGPNGIQFLWQIETEKSLADALRGAPRPVVFFHVMGPANAGAPVSHSARVKSVSEHINARGYWEIAFVDHEGLGAEAPVNLVALKGGYLFYYQSDNEWVGVPAITALGNQVLVPNGDAAIAVPPAQRMARARGSSRNREQITLNESEINQLLDDYVCNGLTHADLDKKYFGEARDNHQGWKSGEILRNLGITGRDRGQGW